MNFGGDENERLMNGGGRKLHLKNFWEKKNPIETLLMKRCQFCYPRQYKTKRNHPIKSKSKI
ncbi:hypothetical protein CROQUDRAFT_215109 [Cronartium quercuum f. sp. fusiforme G11]|uniref:Uncharacterized protein n=1 Tax=Cronartium quercuum f. sp. fusiforme G11 TaxID=708437 RepID=A0A9P6NRL1_9BASI|nr:hypothetical protein CROQUDRAFT_215109 [Cronartium quercuum f. sp. fusiforme G11]